MASILVVDDEVAMRELFKTLLLREGFLALEARTAEEALDLLALTPDIHVVVADLHMPGQGGAWLLNRLRQQYPNVAVILATADERVPGTLSLLPSVVNHLVKPVSRERLLAAVANGLTWHEQQEDTMADRAGGDDPIYAFQDRKLNRRHGDGGETH
jgi:two-component system response regulator CpxR